MSIRRWTRALMLALVVFTGLAGLIGSTVPTARAASTLDVCGTVTVYVKPTALVVGAITIGPVAQVIAAGTTVPSSVAVGANLCVRLTINLGSVTNLVVLQVDSTTSVKICGVISAFTAATSSATGSLTIVGRVFKIAVGETLPASVHAGADLCLDLDLNGLAQIKDAAVTANATATVKICGVVTAYSAATLTDTGTLKIGGRTFVLGLGSNLPASVHVGADLCLTLELNAFAQVQDGSATANVTTTLKICGDVTAYTAATLTQTGVLKIAGRTFVLALGSDLPAAVHAGADLCLTLGINAFGQVQDGTATADVTTTVQICGTVTGYAAASLTDTGTLAIGGHSYVMALGSTLPASVHAGADLCMTLQVNVFGQVADGTAVAAVTTTLDVCGQVTAYVAAQPAANGSLTIGGVSKTVAAGTALSGSVHVGAYLKLHLELDAFGRVDDATVLAAGATLEAACGGGQNPGPTPTPAPGGSPAPSGAPNPSGAPDPSGSPNPSGSPDPGASGSPAPSGGEEGAIGTPAPSDPTCANGAGTTDGSDNAGSVESLTSGPLPDTASFARTGGLVLAVSVPFAAIAGILVGGWLATARRRRMEAEPVTPVAPLTDGSDR